MHLDLTPQQQKAQAEFKAFTDRAIVPFADRADREEKTPPESIAQLARHGYLGATIPPEYGGCGMDTIAYGLLSETIGRGCASLRSLLTVHTMVAQALLKWGSTAQKNQWLPKLATGEAIAAFGLTEPNVGSDAQRIETTATLEGNAYILNGSKKWITYGQIADVFSIFAQCDGKPTAFLVEKNAPGLSIEPIFGMLGARASMLAELRFDRCRIPRENLVGKVGFGLSCVASAALDYGRYSVAWGCVGIAQACLEACLHYTSVRQQFGTYLKEHPLIRQLISDMITQTKAARLLCYQAGYLRQIGDPKSIAETSIAKYFASTTAMKAASDAVQIHGANGCSPAFSVERYWRDAKIMEIIEGSTQIQQLTIASYGYQEYGMAISSKTLPVQMTSTP
ncbi:acyl-CoA dehydrogenase [Cyanosarcina cf. burmensis CCALA 770]|nr:acyl-CoA dehydrogenase [Cyanosarcina cf. burmensis CCALA 770]